MSGETVLPGFLDVIRDLARSYVPELELSADPLGRFYGVGDGAGIWVEAPTELGAWELALAAAQRRGAWRARLAVRRLEAQA